MFSGRSDMNASVETNRWGRQRGGTWVGFVAVCCIAIAAFALLKPIVVAALQTGTEKVSFTGPGGSGSNSKPSGGYPNHLSNTQGQGTSNNPSGYPNHLGNTGGAGSTGGQGSQESAPTGQQTSPA